jgi:hypothetical protein
MATELNSRDLSAVADRLWAALKPTVLKALSDNSAQGVKFNDIEGASGGVGDLMARMLMELSVNDLQEVSPEVLAAMESRFVEAHTKNLDPKASKSRSERVVHKTRERTFKSARGPIRLSREYVYFPALKGGFFPGR